MDDQSSLSHGTTVAILLRLLESGGQTIMKDLADIVSNYQTRHMRVSEMEEDGLIDIITTYTPQKFTNIKLTEKGKTIATTISTIDIFVAHDKNYKDKGFCKKHGESILRLLSDGTPAKLSDIIREIPTPNSVNKALQSLEEDGLVEITLSTESYRTKYIQLTSLGMQCAKVFNMVHDLIKNKG